MQLVQEEEAECLIFPLVQSNERVGRRVLGTFNQIKRKGKEERN